MSSEVPKWSAPRRHARPWTPSIHVGGWRVSQTQLLVVIGVCAITMVSLATMIAHPAGTRWHGAFRSAVNLDSATVDERRIAVREAMEFVWKHYHDRAFGADEINPINGRPSNPWGGIGCMILDSMDTLWIMDLQTEFEQARQWVHEELRFDKMGEISVFETIIRSVGGLLSAYDLSRDRVFLTKAVELTERLLPAIDPKTGRADYVLDMNTNTSHQAGSLAESGTYQLEFEYLSVATGDPKYSKLAQTFYEYLRTQDQLQRRGLFANQIYAFDHGPDKSRLMLSMSGGGDSFYEYLLKVWIFNGQRDEDLTKRMYIDAMDGMRDLLVAETPTKQLYLGEYSVLKRFLRPQMHHLACFVPGMLALGARRMENEDRGRNMRHMLLAKRLLKTCYEEFYEKQPSGLAPESLIGKHLEVSSMAPDYKLRPEVVESLYIMYQITGDTMYQEWGWQIFSAIQRHCRTYYGYSAYRDVTRVVDWEDMTDQLERDMWSVRMLTNRMETFFTAETLKYLYLLFDPTNKHVSLDTHVFNTEAHPLSIPKQ